MEAIERQAKEGMEKALQGLKSKLDSLRAGRAHPGLLDRVMVACYGSEVPLKQVSSISTPDARTLLVQPFDSSIRQEIERGILKADLGVSPRDDGPNLRLTLPPMSEERRKEMVKVAQKTGEEFKVTLRNARRDANDKIKREEKDAGLPEDRARRLQDVIQKLTKQYSDRLEAMVATKEEEILQA